MLLLPQCVQIRQRNDVVWETNPAEPFEIGVGRYVLRYLRCELVNMLIKLKLVRSQTLDLKI